MDLDLDGNVTLVTASSSGLGKASAKALGREGADVVVNGRNRERLEIAAAEIREDATGTVLAHEADITDPDDVSALVERTVTEFGGIDHVVTSAGGPPPMRPLEPSDEDWYDTFDLLVMSVVRLIREAADHLRADGGGSIVYITSMAAKEPKPANVLSGSVRSGVIGYEKILSQELAPDVRSNAVLPGYHETPRLEEYFERAVAQGEYGSYEEAKRDLVGDVSMDCIGDPDVLGNAVAFLCSERANYINGAAIPIDGGRGSTVF